MPSELRENYLLVILASIHAKWLLHTFHRRTQKNKNFEFLTYLILSFLQKKNNCQNLFFLLNSTFGYHNIGIHLSLSLSLSLSIYIYIYIIFLL